MELPKYLIRPSDHAIFELAENDQYANRNNIGKDYIYNFYTYETLFNLGFTTCKEEELAEVIEKQKLYSDYQKWVSRSDGHGGIKGGSMKEYLDYSKRVKEYEKEVELFHSKEFKDNVQDEIKKSTWDVGLPMAYMNNLNQLIHHYKDGTIKIIKNLTKK